MDCFLYDRDLRHERVKRFPINEWIKQFLHHELYKHQNMTSAMVFTIVFGIHYNFFVALPIYLFPISSDFFSHGKTCTSEKLGPSQRFGGLVRQIDIEHAICPGPVQLKSLKFQSLLFY